jgi:hypothetical protein
MLGWNGHDFVAAATHGNPDSPGRYVEFAMGGSAGHQAGLTCGDVDHDGVPDLALRGWGRTDDQTQIAWSEDVYGWSGLDLYWESRTKGLTSVTSPDPRIADFGIVQCGSLPPFIF